MGRSALPATQLAFDLREPLPEWSGTPLRYHTAYATPEQHLLAWDRWREEHGNFGSLQRSGMWHPTMCADPFTTHHGHSFFLLSADCRPRAGERPVPLDELDVPCELLYQAICEECSWHAIAAGENAAVELWHDHAFPAWRDLPVKPAKTRRHDAWLKVHYPPEWQQAGCPLRTERKPPGTRHVAGRSPWDGYDLGSVLATEPT